MSKRRKVKQRPDKNSLYNLILQYSFIYIGRMYGVSDNAIRKWCKAENIPYKSKDIQELKRQII